MKSFLPIILLSIISYTAYAQKDSVYLKDSSILAGKVTRYSDIYVSIVMQDTIKKKVSTNQVDRVLLRNGYEILYSKGLIIATGQTKNKTQILKDVKTVDDKTINTGYHLKKSSDFIKGGAITGFLALTGISYYMLYPPDTAGLLAQGKFNIYTTNVNTWKQNRKIAGFFSTGMGLLSTILFIAGANEINKASQFLSKELDIPVSFNFKGNGVAIVYRF